MGSKRRDSDSYQQETPASLVSPEIGFEAVGCQENNMSSNGAIDESNSSSSLKFFLMYAKQAYFIPIMLLIIIAIPQRVG